MGCDGGTIPKRDELVRLKKKAEKTERDVDLAARWKHCALSQQLLAAPVVSCELGRLYNKDAIIELLLDRSKFEDPAKVEHIKGLKDVKALAFTPNPAYKRGDDKAESYVNRAAEYICPITSLEMSGTYKFQFIWTCACVFSERALKELKSAKCNKCGQEYSPRDIITLNAQGEEMEVMKIAMQDRRAKAKLEKKAKKKKAVVESAGSEEGTSSKKAKLDVQTPSASDAKLSNGDLPNGCDTSKGKDAKSKANGEKSKSSKVVKKDEKKYKSIQDNPNTSAAFKSLFSSSEEAKSKGTAFWVTHNPFYN